MKKSIKKILIANRGEIACRIIRTCNTLGLSTVAIYSDPDADAKFVRLADEALSLGGSASAESYLDISKIIKAAKKSKADAIHPGYGFLSENAEFAKAVKEAGLIFIGPKPQTILQMGSKAESKELMKKAGVPTIPGYQGKNQEIDFLLQEAEKIGFPCMVKASAGGGGKGLKQVFKKSDLQAAIESAKREAKSSFGDDTLLIEKFIENPRHIEIQVFGDTQGNVIHLFERECTLQRRHQKVIEEAPSSVLDEKLRKQMGQAAVKAAKAVNYLGAGTVEFILDAKGQFYFLEMNTRLQVEHPVTEFITGLDLVQLQIQVAQGEPLPIKQKDLTIQGHAMEARVYAEDPNNGFLPVTGQVVYLNLPNLNDVRYDVGIESQDVIDVYYDPMIGKIIAHASDRTNCIHLLATALKQSTILGTTTNLNFLHDLILQPDHIKGNFDTGFIDKNLNKILKSNQQESTDPFVLGAALYYLITAKKNSKLPLMSELSGFRISPNQKILDKIYCDGNEFKYLYRVLDNTKDKYEFTIENKTYIVQLNHLKDNDILFILNDNSFDLIIAQNHDVLYIKTPRGQMKFESVSAHQSTTSESQTGNLTAPLPGKVLKVNVKPDQEVTAGETLMIVEAMKMEHPIKAAKDGKVNTIYFKENDTVKLGDVLLDIN